LDRGIRGHWIERRGLELDATDELACERDEDQREIAGSEGVAMVLLAVDHPPLRVQERLGPIAVAVSQVENEVMHLHKTRVENRSRDARVSIGPKRCHGVPRRRRRWFAARCGTNAGPVVCIEMKDRSRRARSMSAPGRTEGTHV